MCRRQGVIATDADQREKMFRQAEASYQRILSMDPTDGRAYVGLGRLLEIERRYDDARRLLEDGCAVAGRSFNSLSLRTSHERGCCLEGANPFLWTALGNLEAKENRLDAARNSFEAAITADRSVCSFFVGGGPRRRSAGPTRRRGTRGGSWRRGTETISWRRTAG